MFVYAMNDESMAVVLSDIRRKPACDTFKTATPRRFFSPPKSVVYAAIARRLLSIEVDISSFIYRNDTLSHFGSPVHVTGLRRCVKKKYTLCFVTCYSVVYNVVRKAIFRSK